MVACCIGIGGLLYCHLRLTYIGFGGLALVAYCIGIGDLLY
jgi:hypothetical protein